MTPDVRVHRNASFTVIEPLSKVAVEWTKKNVQVESWQRVGVPFTYAVESRMAGDIEIGMREAGLLVDDGTAAYDFPSAPSPADEVGLASPAGVGGNDQNGLLAQGLRDAPGDAAGVGSVPGAARAGSDDLHDEGRLGRSLPNPAGLEPGHAGEAAADRPLNHSLHVLRGKGLARSSGNSAANVQARGADRAKLPEGHVVSLSQARARLECRAGRDLRVQYIIVDGSSGKLVIETSWLPAGALKAPWRRLKSGSYQAKVEPENLPVALAQLGDVMRGRS